jgi:hypothetical protein
VASSSASSTKGNTKSPSSGRKSEIWTKLKEKKKNCEEKKNEKMYRAAKSFAVRKKKKMMWIGRCENAHVKE